MPAQPRVAQIDLARHPPYEQIRRRGALRPRSDEDAPAPSPAGRAIGRRDYGRRRLDGPSRIADCPAGFISIEGLPMVAGAPGMPTREPRWRW